jgi:molybdopterin molybdotransferase
MTGAAMPSGCDTVIPIEDIDERADGILLREKVVPRQHVRFRGEDIRKGDRIVSAGTILRSPEISMLASFGKAYPSVHCRARVAVLSTGDELIEVGEPPEYGKVVNSNALSLAAALREIGAEPAILGIARDNRESHLRLMNEGLKADALITTAGVSAGDRDLVRACLAELGVRQLFWKVDIKPGGPFAFGMKEGKPVFSLPGNPVSSMITFEELVRPALLRMMGRRRVIRPLVKATLRGDVRKKPGKIHFLRVRVEVEDGQYRAASAGDQSTGILSTMVRANGIAVLPKERTEFAAGEKVPVHLLHDDLGMMEE